jgi:diguanylate cyclase (GGDEF)-like protein/PAS domain S-box-containing protein
MSLNAPVNHPAIESLKALGVLDTAPEAQFDAIARIASTICGTPISLVSLLDERRQWFKANVGLETISETDREAAFCAHAVLSDDLMVVPDAQLDQRFASNPLVTGKPHIRFYAGAPITIARAHRVGALCVIDRVPRELTESQKLLLSDLAKVAGVALEGRAAAAQISEAMQLGAKARLLLHHSPDAVISISPQGRIQSWNPAAEALFGYPASVAVGMQATVLVPGHLKQQEKLAYARLVEDGQQYYESTRVRADGSFVQVAITLSPELNERGDIVGVTKFVRDISLLRKTEQDLATSEADMRLVFNNSPSMLAYWNRDLTNRFANSAYEKWFGVDARELKGRHLRELLGSELFELNKPYIEGVLAGEPQIFEREIATPSGMRHSLARYVPDQRDGEVVGFLVEVSDVTPLKQAQIALEHEVATRKLAFARLAETAGHLEEAQRIGQVGNWHWDAVADQTFYSPEMYRILGLDAAVGAPKLSDRGRIYTPESFARIQEWVKQAIATGVSLEEDLEFVRPDGTHGWIEARGEAVYIDGCVVALRGTAREITERRRLMGELAEQHELMRVTLESIADAVITTDAQGAITWLNPVAEHLTGWLNTEAVGHPLSTVLRVIHEEPGGAEYSSIGSSLEEGSVGMPLVGSVLISRNGTAFGIEDSVAPILDRSGKQLGTVIIFRDVTEQRRLSNEIAFRATHDGLTGLVNRSEFEARLKQALERARLYNGIGALLYIDLDQFKIVNDACGHAAGDELLQQVARRLKDCVRTSDTVARLGGDEFGVLLHTCTQEDAEAIAQKICELIDVYRFVHEGQRYRIGVSIGLVPIDQRWSDLSSILKAADACCFTAKESGRNRVHAWRQHDAQRHARGSDMQWATRLEQALDEDRILLYAQRILPLKETHSVLHAEVLVRLREADGGIVLPGAFLRAAERFNLATRIDRFVLKKALATLAQHTELRTIGTLNVNLSGVSVSDYAFHRYAIQTLRAAGTEICQRLCLEVTETAAISNMNDAVAFIDQVRALGCRVALDDFGAGTSSFGYLKSLPVDMIKIDGQFVTNMNNAPLDEAAVQCFVQVAKIVGVQVVAECVEQQDVYDRLKALGVDWVQGFLLHHPQPLHELLERSIRAL